MEEPLRPCGGSYLDKCQDGQAAGEGLSGKFRPDLGNQDEKGRGGGMLLRADGKSAAIVAALSTCRPRGEDDGRTRALHHGSCDGSWHGSASEASPTGRAGFRAAVRAAARSSFCAPARRPSLLLVLSLRQPWAAPRVTES